MKKMIYMISLLFLLGCTGANIKYSDTEMKNGLIYAKNNSKPYTGKVTYSYLDLGNNNILGIESFVDGKLEGVRTEYYENGEVKAKFYFKDGKLEGTSKFYYMSGNIEEELIFVNGKLEISRKYYENGQLELDVDYNRNKFEKYNEQGERMW